MPQAKEVRMAQKINIMLSCMLMFAAAGDVSFGVFSVPIERASGLLTTVWSSSLGLASMFAAPVMIATGFFLDNVNDKERDGDVTNDGPHLVRRRLRIIALPVSFGYLTMALAVPAIYIRSQISVWLLRAAAIPLAVPTGVAYMTSINVLLLWIPNRPALAMSFCSASYGISQFVLAPILSVSILKWGVETTLLWTAILMTALTFVTLSLVRHPFQEESIHLVSAIQLGTRYNESNGFEGDVLISSGEETSSPCPIINWRTIFYSRSFVLYMLVLLFGRAAYALLPFFFELGVSFTVTTRLIVVLFQSLSLCAIIYSFLSNALIDALSQRGGSVVRQAFVITFVFQAILFLCLYILSSVQWSILAMSAIAVLIILLESQTALGVMLGREVFGIRNCTAVYGVAGGLSIGLGEGLFTWIMGVIEKANLQYSNPRSLAFQGFFLFASGISVFGAVCVILIEKI